MLLRNVGNKTNFALDMHAVFGKHRGVASLFPLFNVQEICVLTLNHLFFYSFMTPGVGGPDSRGVQIREEGPIPLANMDSRGSISASGFGRGVHIL